MGKKKIIYLMKSKIILLERCSMIKEKTEDILVIPMTFDQMFKTVLRSSKDYTIKLIYLITGIPISILNKAEFVDASILDENISSKHQISDLIISVDNLSINLELNNYKIGTLIKNTAYIFGIYKNMLKTGEEYVDKYQVIQINFNNFDNDIDDQIINEYRITNICNHEILTKVFGIYNINLAKLEKEEYTKSVNEELIDFLKIMKAKTIKELKDLANCDQVLKEVASIMVDYSKRVNVIGLYDKEEVDRKMHNTQLYYAKEQGAQDKQISIVKNMLKEKLNIDVISKVTNLSKQEIENLNNLFQNIALLNLNNHYHYL